MANQYFSHDIGARSDPKIQALISEHGAEGYGRFWILVEMLYQDENGRLSLQKKYNWNAIAMQMQCKVDAARDFVMQCIDEYELFATDGDFLWSESVNKRRDRMSEISQKRRNAAQKRWSDIQNDANAYQLQSKSNASAPKKNKKIKKEIKGGSLSANGEERKEHSAPYHKRLN